MRAWTRISLTVMGGVLLATKAADLIVARGQVRALRSQVGRDDVLAAIAMRVGPGMTRAEAESRIVGARGSDATITSDGQTVVVHEYWFGFLPPLSKSGLKYIGEVTVSYDQNERVIQASHWYN